MDIRARHQRSEDEAEGDSTQALNAEMATALLRAQLLDNAALARAERTAAETGVRLDRTIAELGLIDEEIFCVFLAAWLDRPLIEEDAVQDLPITGVRWDASFLRRNRIAPVALSGTELTLAMADPFDDQAAETVAYLHQVTVDRAVASARTIDAVLTRFFSAGQADEVQEEATEHDLERIRDRANEGPVVRLVSDILAAAVDTGASDIHVESLEAGLQVRFRIDGTLVGHAQLPESQSAAVISRLKVMARLNISERRLPQDGRIRVPVRGREIDFRISCLPTQYGESVVLRVLDRRRIALDWSSLGFEPELIAKIEAAVARPNGLFLVTGPTGSGKTTTLYTALSGLDAARRKIVTIEDPIEYALPGVNQVHVDPAIGYGFATALRATLRQDPNVIMVGEIRDLETAENAIRAALMGRMVLSTVHTNSAVGAIDRLLDLGVEPFLLAATLRGVLSQRLVPRLCESCAEPASDPVVEAMLRQEAGVSDVRLRTAKGCPACRSTGFNGRLVVAELLLAADPLRQAILAWEGSGAASQEDLLENARPLRLAGLHAVARGATTLAEVFQVIDG